MSAERRRSEEMSRRNLAYDTPDPDTRRSEGPPSGPRSTTDDLAEQVNTLEQSLRDELNVFERPGRVQPQDRSRRHLSSTLSTLLPDRSAGYAGVWSGSSGAPLAGLARDRRTVGNPTDADRRPDSATSLGQRRMLPTIKLGNYDGSTALETHLAKFENCSAYYGWTSRDRLFHLKASLDGHAGHVLWEIDTNSSEADVIKLLRNRFGNDNQVERFRAELRTRRRKSGESVQNVYQDIRRLLTLGFRGQSGELCEIIGRDAFLEALGDQPLRIRVLDQQPKTLDAALQIVCRMEAYSNPTINLATAENGEYSRQKVRSVAAASLLENGPVTSTVDDRRLQKLEESVANQQREIRQLRSDAAEWKGRA